jgi:hypothetical protein
MAGPKRPQDSVPLTQAKAAFVKSLTESPKHAKVQNNGDSFDLADGSVVIAAITSCTNTSNPSLMLGAGLLAKKAVERGLTTKPWVKTSYRLHRESRSLALSRSSSLPSRGLRLHHLHRQQRPASRIHQQSH